MTVILSPHLDDAALSCYASIRGATVITVFAGLPPTGEPSIWDRLCGYDDGRVLMEARRAEDRAALAALAEVVHLDYPESLHRNGGGPDAAAVAVALADHAPRGSLCLAPLAGGPKANPDHRVVRDAARALLRDGRDVVLYADVPYCCKTNLGWPSALGGDHPNPRWINRMFRETPEAESGLTVETRLLDDETYAAKMETLRAYVTQFVPLNTKLRTKGLLDIEEVTRRETLVPLVPSLVAR